MYITDEGLNEIERCAEKGHNAKIMLMCQILREVRELDKKLQNINDASNSGNNCTCGTDDSKNFCRKESDASEQYK